MDATECCICMETLQDKNIAVTSCGHKFCLECLLKHYKSKNDCPLCRQELVKSGSLSVVSQEQGRAEHSHVIIDDMMYYEIYANMLAEAEAARVRRLEQRRREREERERQREQRVASRNPIQHIIEMFSQVDNRQQSQPRCGICRQHGHNRRTCPTRNQPQRVVF
jgi:hypothetical protein